MTSQDEAKVKIDDKEYVIADLSEPARDQIISMRAAEQEIESAKMKMAIATTARNAYANALKEELAKED